MSFRPLVVLGGLYGGYGAGLSALGGLAQQLDRAHAVARVRGPADPHQHLDGLVGHLVIAIEPAREAGGHQVGHAVGGVGQQDAGVALALAQHAVAAAHAVADAVRDLVAHQAFEAGAPGVGRPVHLLDAHAQQGHHAAPAPALGQLHLDAGLHLCRPRDLDRLYDPGVSAGRFGGLALAVSFRPIGRHRVEILGHDGWLRKQDAVRGAPGRSPASAANW
jgi:hypothetical protein